ncbi:MAG TPA: hypothetical protein VN778_01030 [Verrucomicrobiae bacterium]|nr:hypothetical protein [Verrucomicrobiae bacterium]
MSPFEGLQISKLPLLRNLQTLQFAVNLIEDVEEKEAVARRGLNNPVIAGILGQFLGIDASLAYGPQVSTSNKYSVFDSGLLFAARAQKVDYDCNYEIPVESIVIEFPKPKQLVPESVLFYDEDGELPDRETIETLEETAAPEIKMVRVPVLAIRACAVEIPRAA